MPQLLDLSPELISCIVEDLAPCTQTLDSLCLTGNHNLLALVRPYTWREINTTLDDTMTKKKAESSKKLAARFEEFFEDPAKSSLVRSLNITLLGLFDSTTPAILALVNNLDKLTNVTHASVCCVDSRIWCSSPSLFVKWVVVDLASLLSLKVDCCPGTGDDDANFLDMSEYPIPSLRHIATRYCDLDLSILWKYCPNLKVVEMAGGDEHKFWLENARDTSKEREDCSHFGTGIHFIGSIDLEHEPVLILDKLENINVTSDAEADNCHDLSEIFNDESSEPPAALKDLCVTLSMDVGEFGKILRAVSGPIIQRLAIMIPDKSRWVPSELQTLLEEFQEGAFAQIGFFARFETLHELGLPFDGLSPELMDILLALLPHAPMLQHLTFDPPEDDAESSLAEAADKYLRAIHTLVSVSWRHELSFHAYGRADESGGDFKVVSDPYLTPAWHQWSGIGEWWEVDPLKNEEREIICK
ncbi:hypothetical protein FB451DRAFT_1223867 [Mycena latifolia]|nr:hypothetical protein FB451DRAFT_1223867 [Mycena latifolia]